ncbi:MAG: hypothetical protein AAFQ53_18115, partial [Bacteroidota bacterium]
AYASQHVGVVRLSDATLAPFFSAYLSPDGPGQKQLMRESYGQSKPGLSLVQLRNLVVPVLPADERESIDAAIASVAGLLSHEHNKLAGLQQVKAGLLQDLLTGAVRVAP